MPVIIQAFVLCDTEDAAAGLAGVRQALASASFESANPVADFAVGVRGAVPSLSAPDGQFLSLVPEAAGLEVASDPSAWCGP